MSDKTETRDQEDRTVYIRPVSTIDLPEDVRSQIEGMDHVYSVNTAMGERIALVKDRNLAFVLARQHDLAPVSVH